MDRKLGTRIPRLAIYPPFVAAAFVVNQFAVGSAPLQGLPRPLIVAVALALVVQLVLSIILRSRDHGAMATIVVLFLLIDLSIVALVLLAGIAVATLVALGRHRSVRSMPWPRATSTLNVVAVVFLVVATVNGATQGALTSPVGASRAVRGTAQPGSPDIYLIMLDGYPRADTLATKFQLDNQPFLDTLTGLGFKVASRSHSNYDLTVLTLPSMFNGQQIPALMPNPPADTLDQVRALTRVLNQGRQLDALRQAGYEIVTIPSEFSEVALFSADRFLDSGQLTTFETQLLSTAGITKTIGGIERTWLPAEHRARILSALTTLDGLATERSTTPKFVFAHVLAPHMPIAFDRSGGPAEPLPCFPATCSMYYFGDAYGDAIIGPMRDQIAWLNGAVVDTVRTIQARSATPPVIVLFSDHGMRIDAADRDEMFRSLFLASTPGKEAVFPDDMTPVNMIPRLLNAYAGQSSPLASEESYWVDTRNVLASGIFPRQVQPIANP